ncbi:thermosome subunit beta [Sulfolobus acidocaldarius]|uniref:Chaperonin subunit beta n=4 Tax=Sulfolobus acidocaldarius TaxID=2285 RepID=THSB_SULAC|nr:thermosome subunit beta [Sulfolobus acidocaldarius]Q9V2T4.2 RecName: Full=Thermosome subunit beta; AltName: Full=Chaperonin subunit beta; AltName: Full=Thermophilic factor 55 beta; Short=TF55-beta; AltName: Full=Thermosome subunit 2 [Sulfolobus acidocaldarius DSM 639]AHC51054.1 thermosome subunit [Sulfolobus acidocaldarius SUSAZ]AAY80050.1 thermosome beta subunit [Sulfolobus acidocaldarius DSM 639]AGE70621.1 thermosome [Sulfolobus acidocaldarius N8]AGE72894.1 thermosome [Sulfolobus acidocal
MSATATVATTPEGIPVIILKEGSSRTYGKEALRINIAAVKAVEEALKTTYGPRGMDKMLVDSLGDITITNDGATILDKMDLQHPAAKLLVQIAKGQDEETADGTKTAVIFSGELVKKAEELLYKEIHPTIIVSGYKKAEEMAIKTIEEISTKVSVNDTEILRKVALTSLSSKAVAGAREHLADIVVKAITQVAELRGDKWYVDLDNVQIVKKHGGSINDTQIVYGIIVDKEVVHPGMPKRVENAKIALLDASLEVEKPELDAEIRINDPTQMKKFLDEEENILKEKVDKIAQTGANVVICQKGIDEVAQHYLAKKGILAVRRAKKSDLEKLARATGGRVVSNIDELTSQDLGYATLVEERKIGEDKMVFIEGAKNPKAVSILIRGGLERVVDETERALRDALGTVADVVRDGRAIAGGGAVETEIAKRLRKYAPQVGGKEQLAIEAYANALESLVMILIENGGFDPIELLVKLRSAHENETNKWHGINVYTGQIQDMWSLGVIEPAVVKMNAIKAATEASTLILRIDDLISAGKKSEGKTGEKKESEKGKEED